MVLTLYKNCILKEDYSEVFDPSVRDEYLNSLDYEEFYIDDVYYQMNGSLTFDFTTAETNDPFKYNYLKLDNREGESDIFAFITNAEFVGQGLVRLTYRVDVWNTFIDRTVCRNSIIANTWSGPSNLPRFLPIEYETLDPLTIDESLINSTYAHKVRVVMEIQKYDTTSSSQNPTGDARETFVSFIAHGETFAETYLTIPEAEEAIQVLTNMAAGNNLIIYKNPNGDRYEEGVLVNALGISNNIGADFKHYYEITRIYLIPAQIARGIESSYAMTKTFYVVPDIDEPYYNFWLPCQGSGTTYTYPTPNWKLAQSLTVPANYKNVAVGPYTAPIAMENNGQAAALKIYSSCDAFNLNLLMRFQGQEYDITPMYEVDIPFTPINGETAQLRKIADREKRNNAIAKIVGSTISEAGNALGIWKGANAGTPSDTMVGKASSSLSSAGSYLSTVATNVNSIIAASAAKYQTTYGKPIDIVGAINAYYGLVIFRKTNTYNDAEVEYAIYNAGYETNYIVPPIDESHPWDPFRQDNGFNPLRYSRINLYGGVPHNIARQLERILTSGTRIWYQGSLELEVE